MLSVFRLFLLLLFPLFGMGTQFLTLPTSAEELCIGSHPTLSGNYTLNPAVGYANGQNPGLVMSRGVWLGDVSLSRLSYIQTYRGKTFHLGGKYSGLSDLEFRSDVPQDEAFTSFSTYGFALDGGLSFKRENQNFGFSLNYIFMGLYTETSSGLGINIGYTRFFKNKLKFGLSLQNIGIMTKLETSSPNLPLRLLGGISKVINFNEYQNTLFGSIELNKLSPSAKFYFGNHFRWNRLEIMGGFATSEKVIESSAGLGLILGIYQIKYAVQFGSQYLGTPQIFTIQIRLP
ncbi:MAG: hypothetical protein CMG57_07270 [Candidatus Marinimicrobia bacterium]|nr:hypothetical protein [Candidatus Neomarinimicrobiota bacterium]|tara:strand:+ start:1267 stop:2133 length:867 start_codon:yes stop_codon:yes gene_type:complete